MYNHAPKNYISPFKLLIDRERLSEIESNIEDLIYEDEYIFAFVSSRTESDNQGNVLIVPREVHENIYDITDDLLAKIHVFSKRVALAMKVVYGCDAVSLRQHNEPDGYQDVWHYHLHVIPRYKGDNLYPNYPERKRSVPEVRAQYAGKLREYFSKHN